MPGVVTCTHGCHEECLRRPGVLKTGSVLQMLATGIPLAETTVFGRYCGDYPAL
jgi:hypothetical protein